MEKMTSGCYGELVNSWGCNWVGLVYNKDPPRRGIYQVPL